MELKKIGVWSTAKIFCLMGAVIGLFSGVLSMIYTRILINNFSDVAQQLNVSQPTGVLSILISIISCIIIYFIIGALGAFFYNLFAGWIGGIHLEFTDKKK